MKARTDQEIRLLDYAERLSRHADDRLAVHLHLSRLRAHHRREHHIRIAANTFDLPVKRFDGQIFLLSSNDIVFVAKGASRSEIDEVVLKLRYLFSEDPLTQDESWESGAFCTWYDLTTDYEDFLVMATRLKQEADERRALETSQAKTQRAAPRRPQIPMKPEHLGRLVEQLASMDISALMRRQPVCAMAPNGELRPVFNELFVSIADLQRMVMPDIDMLASPPLFTYLTQYLDQRIMRALPDIEASVPLSTSINVNINTILSPQFIEFDNKLRLVTRKTIVLELQPADMFADVGAFMFARDFVRSRGYRVCLDGLTYLTFPLIDGRKLKLDLHKITWSADALEDGGSERRKEFAEAVRRAGPTRVILCRCDSEQAFEFGRSLGLSLFQGRLVDQMLSQAAANARVA
ncbi:MAG: hypothetical protein VYB54_07320 [Pseudomonadota bacterium]|nr:hypothetical protein [Pseudomonadota bacterium]